MIHTEGVTEGIWFNHNGDFSGEVWIGIRDGAAEVEYAPANAKQPEDFPGYHTVKIPFADLKRLVAEYVLNRKVERLEQGVSDDDILEGRI